MKKETTTFIVVVLIALGLLFLFKGNFGFLGAVTTFEGCNGNSACEACVSQDSVCSGDYIKYYEYANGVCSLGSGEYCANGCAYGHCLGQDYGAVCSPDGTYLCKHTYYETSTSGFICDSSNIEYCDGGCINGECTDTPLECYDSDNGLNYYSKGTATDNYGDSVSDYCYSGNEVYEYYCNDGYVASTIHTCLSGESCSNGRCITSTPSGCTNPTASHGDYECVSGDVRLCENGAWTLFTECDYGCSNGVCQSCSPTTEVCDNKDNDCDGQIDEGLDCGVTTYTYICIGTTISSASATLGNCDSGDKCGDDGNFKNMQVDSTTELTLTQLKNMLCTECVETTEVCDGADNDCDGQIDEGLTCGNKNTITWNTYFSIPDFDLISGDLICTSVNDCNLIEGKNVDCIDSPIVQRRIYESYSKTCEEALKYSNWLTKLLVDCGNVGTATAWEDNGGYNLGVCIAESEENSIGGYWEKALHFVNNMGIPAQYVLMATILGIIVIVVLIMSILK